MNTVLRLQGFGTAFGERVILSSVDLEIRDREAVVLLGPCGTGKSTLLRTLAGFNNSNPALRTWGSAQYAGNTLGEGDAPALVSQSARLMMSSVLENVVHALPERASLTPSQQRGLAARLLREAGLANLEDRLDEPVMRLPLATQRHLAILRLAVAGPRLLCIDEPTSGISEDEALPLLEYIARERAYRALLVVVHNQKHARLIGDTVALLAGGTIQETGTASAFFTAPRSTAARDFVRSGSCSVPAPDAHPATLDADTAAPPPVPAEAQQYVSDSFGPRGFLWLKKGRLAGTPRPGIFFDLDYDLRALTRVGVTCLVTLTETQPDVAAFAAHGISSLWFPVPDMGAPSMAQAAAMCARIDMRLARDDVIAVHCRAGLGRTGTVLAAYLIWEGKGALEALETVRRVDPRWVQSSFQVEFLEKFAEHMTRVGSTRPMGQSLAVLATPTTTEGTKHGLTTR
jgi:atypical dual specificity phosphatase